MANSKVYADPSSPIVFQAPKGFASPDAGEQVEAMATVVRNPDGGLVLIAIDGYPLGQEVVEEPESADVTPPPAEEEENEDNFLQSVEDNLSVV